MLGWLWRNIIGDFHAHRWVIIAQVSYTEMWDKDEPIMRGTKRILQCSVCGNIKRVIT